MHRLRLLLLLAELTSTSLLLPVQYCGWYRRKLIQEFKHILLSTFVRRYLMVKD